MQSWIARLVFRKLGQPLLVVYVPIHVEDEYKLLASLEGGGDFLLTRAQDVHLGGWE